MPDRPGAGRRRPTPHAARTRQRNPHLKLPVGEGTVDDFESQGHPLNRVEHLRCVGSGRNRRAQLEYDLRFDLRREHASNVERSRVRRRVPHGVVIHVRPDERLQLQRAPDRLVRVADFAANGRVPAGAPQAHELRFHVVGRNQIKSRNRRGRRRWHHLPLCAGRHQIMRNGRRVDGRRHAVAVAGDPAAFSRAPSTLSCSAITADASAMAALT